MAIGGWFANGWVASRKAGTDLAVHRDGLTFELITAAREEVASARSEIDDLRGELAKLRPLEEHLYHFQQALDHLEAVLTADTSDRKSAERNARAFLNRMRRLADAKGTISNEVQRVKSATDLASRVLGEEDKPK